MGIFLLLLLPVLVIFFILYMCKIYNFSLFPRGMKGKRPKPWKFPKVQRDAYRWDSYSSDEEYSSDSDDSSSSDDDYADYVNTRKPNDTIKRQIETSGSFYGTMVPGGMKQHNLPIFHSQSKEQEVLARLSQRDTPNEKLVINQRDNANTPNEKPKVIQRGRGGRGRTSSVSQRGTRGKAPLISEHSAQPENKSNASNRGTNRGKRGRGARKISVYDPDILDPSKEVRYIDERDYDAMTGADAPND